MLGHSKIEIFEMSFSIEKYMEGTKMKEFTMVLDEGSVSLDEMFADTRVVVFERSQGWNSSVLVAVEELHRTIAHLRGSRVLVTSSMGAFTGLSYANRYPGLLSALVLLDPSHPQQGTSAQSILESYGIPHDATYADLWSFFDRSNIASETGCAELAKIRTLGDLPLLVLTIRRAPGIFEVLPKDIQSHLLRDRQEMLRQYARLSSQGEFQIVDSVGHAMASEAPARISEIIRSYLCRIL